MATNYIFNNGGNNADFSDVFIPVSAFAQGQLWLSGQASSGQLGDNTLVIKSSPVQTISGGINWKQVSAGFNYNAAIKTDGTLWLWGSNTAGELGDNTVVSKSSPVQTVSAGTNWEQVCGGNSITTAIKSDGTLWTWGNGANGNLGDNTVVSKSSPVQTIAGGTNWKQVSFQSAIKTDGTLWTWGQNTTGRLGDNTTVNKSSPVQTIAGGTNWKQVSANSVNVAAIKTDGTLWIWGYNAAGQLGDQTIADRTSPIQTVSGGTNWKQISFFASLTVTNIYTAAIKTDGTLWTWGINTSGNLGDNTIVSKSSPVQTIAGGTNWKQVSAGTSFSGAIKTDGTLWLWGNNINGQLGNNSNTNVSSPIQTIAGGTNWIQVSVSSNTTMAAQNNF
jgi:alpha-tubulin suppressor-like RCC1 family protein